ncbi:hypothetical protein P2318_29775 [Myxococcaceae bacterium GXIMD 01537]
MLSAALALGLLLTTEGLYRSLPPDLAGTADLGNGYFPVSESQEVLADGELRATVQGGPLRARRGYTPIEVTLRNNGPSPRTVRLSFRTHSTSGGRGAHRTVEVAPGQQLTTFLLAQSGTPAGNITLESPGIESNVVSMYMDGSIHFAVLVLGNEAALAETTAVPRVERDAPRFSARFMAAGTAPSELAAYVGYDAVVLAQDAASVPAEVWTALEAYAATGGLLVLPRPPRDVGERLPLLTPGASGEQDVSYGAGRVLLCGGSVSSCGQSLQFRLTAAQQAVHPGGPPPRWQRRGGLLSDGRQPLLENARAPVGRFLAVIFLFTLVVGPGGLMLARRKGPVALLVVVPGVALVTCLAIIANSILVDGFGVHTSRFGYTWLDRANARAVTVGLGAWYANLPPDAIQLPATSALLGPQDSSEHQLELDWTSGLQVQSGFLRSRTYKEWGELSVVPTRARLVARVEGAGVRVQNALGLPLHSGYVNLGGRMYILPSLDDGAEGVAVASETVGAAQMGLDGYVTLPPAAEERFSFGREALLAPLPEGGFTARVGGAGFSPLVAALPAEVHDGVHFVRGQVDGT